MPPTDATPGQPPSRGLLVTLGVAVIAALVYLAWPAATPQIPPSNQSRASHAQEQAARTSASLDVRLDALSQAAPQPAQAQRNPFRFEAKPQATSGMLPPGGRSGLPANRGAGPPPGPPPPPPIPPIPLRFIGINGPVGGGRHPGKVAIFVQSDGRGKPVYGQEGQLVLGQYRIIKIGIESVVMEYADGRGRQTIPLRGQ